MVVIMVVIMEVGIIVVVIMVVVSSVTSTPLFGLSMSALSMKRTLGQRKMIQRQPSNNKAALQREHRACVWCSENCFTG